MHTCYARHRTEVFEFFLRNGRRGNVRKVKLGRGGKILSDHRQDSNDDVHRFK